MELDLKSTSNLDCMRVQETNWFFERRSGEFIGIGRRIPFFCHFFTLLGTYLSFPYDRWRMRIDILFSFYRFLFLLGLFIYLSTLFSLDEMDVVVVFLCALLG